MRRVACLKRSDRVLWVLLSRFWSGWRRCLQMVQPATVIAWHRRAFALYWTWKSRRPPGRPNTTAEIRDLIRRMSHANPLWGAPPRSRGTPKVGNRGGAIDGGQVSATAPEAAHADLANVPDQSCGLDRLLYRSDRNIPGSVCLHRAVGFNCCRGDLFGK